MTRSGRTRSSVSCAQPGQVQLVLDADPHRATAEAKYVLKDKAKETELGDTLVNILARAKRQKLFDGLTIYFTPNIEPAVKVLQKIATSGNAIVSLPAARLLSRFDG